MYEILNSQDSINPISSAAADPWIAVSDHTSPRRPNPPRTTYAGVVRGIAVYRGEIDLAGGRCPPRRRAPSPCARPCASPIRQRRCFASGKAGGPILNPHAPPAGRSKVNLVGCAPSGEINGRNASRRHGRETGSIVTPSLPP